MSKFTGSCPHCRHVGDFDPLSTTQDLLSTAGGFLDFIRKPLTAGKFVADAAGGKTEIGTPGSCPNCKRMVMQCPYCLQVNPHPGYDALCVACKTRMVNNG